ncbi:MAG TPA: T9SS type A sorting domain-containing protein, partial [Bacteroidales bacterium]|nr:T9SS type A sorting domain-containing protein [Bacteroidales bacterium]
TLILMLALGAANARGQGQFTLQTDTVWAADTVKIHQNIIVPAGITLTIEAGAVVEFQDNYSIDVYGKLRAIGTPSNRILFTVRDTTMFADTTTLSGGWGSLRFLQNQADTSVLSYCIFSYGKAVVPGAFWSQGGEDNKGGAIYANGYKSLVIFKSLFERNHANYYGGAIYVKNVQKFVLTDCIFRRNSTYDYGAGLAAEQSNLWIEGNLFQYNVAIRIQGSFWGPMSSGSGGGLYAGLGTLGTIISNQFFNNWSVSGTLYETSYNVSVVNNLIANNHSIALMNGHGYGISKYFNNTVVNNLFGTPGTPGFFYSSPHITVRNNIIHGNAASFGGEPFQIYTIFSQLVNLSYSCIADPPVYYYGEGNIAGPPMFVNPTQGSGPGYDGSLADWSLMDNSPCVNAGTPDTTGLGLPATDLLGNPRIFGGRIDMGAIENQRVVVSLPPNPLVSARVQVYPNPFRDSPRILVHDSSRIRSMEIFNQSGQSVGEISLDILHNGSIIELSRLPRGLYLLRTQFRDGSNETTKLIKE